MSIWGIWRASTTHSYELSVVLKSGEPPQIHITGTRIHA
jgi:hypothetical protein